MALGNRILHDATFPVAELHEIARMPALEAVSLATLMNGMEPANTEGNRIEEVSHV